MESTPRSSVTAALLAALVVAACARQPAVQGGVRSGGGPRTPAEQARADGGIQPYTKADVEFMQGMINHHAQAVVMSGWAPSRTTRRDVLVLCERIVNAQRDEIAMMQRWLRARHQDVPDPDLKSDRAGMDMPGMSGMNMDDMLMPGMLT
ncbi:MAG: DUF305 domain-containing protein, partial [Gemmatimonadales bacterium]